MEGKSIILVVSPLVALMEEQVTRVEALGISAVHVSGTKLKERMKMAKEGRIQVIFISPEALFSGTVWKQLLSTDVYRTNLAGMIVDEAHCIKKW